MYNQTLCLERAKYITSVVIYGTIGLFLRYVSLPSDMVALCRGAIGSLFILLYMKLRRTGMDLTAVRKNLRWLILSGIFLGLNWVFLFAAYTLTTIAVASLCNYMAPMILILVSPVLLREKLDRRKLPCVAAALAGIILISGVPGGSAGNPSGILTGLAAALCFVALVICNRKIRGISAYDKAVIQLAVSALTILPYSWIHAQGNVFHTDTQSVLIILLLGVVHTGAAYCLYFSALGSLPVQTIAVLGYLEPVVSVLCSAFLLREPIGVSGWTGAFLILSAAVISEALPDRIAQPEAGFFVCDKGGTVLDTD